MVESRRYHSNKFGDIGETEVLAVQIQYGENPYAQTPQVELPRQHRNAEYTGRLPKRISEMASKAALNFRASVVNFSPLRVIDFHR